MSVLKRIFVDFPAKVMSVGSNPHCGIAVSDKAKQSMVDAEPNGAYFIPGTTLPIYFVMHSDHSYSIASPQPHRPDPNNSKATINVLEFLLSQAPMIDAPTSLFQAEHAVKKFAYIHPKTLAKIMMNTFPNKAPYVILYPSPTRWVCTTLMPEGRVIYSSNTVPGLEKTLA